MQHNHEVDIVKFDDRSYQVRCVQCGELFEAKRSDAAFCSPRCRIANHKEPVKRQNAIYDIEAMGRRAGDYADKYKRSSDVYEAMLKLQRDLAAALSQFED